MILLVIQCNVGMFILFKNRKISFNEISLTKKYYETNVTKIIRRKEIY